MCSCVSLGNSVARNLAFACYCARTRALTGAGLFCVVLRFLGKKTLAKFMDESLPHPGSKCIVNGKKVLCATGDTKRTLIL